MRDVFSYFLAVFTRRHECEVRANMCVCACMHTCLCVRDREVEGVSSSIFMYWYLHQWTILWQNLSVLPYFITFLLCISTLHTHSFISILLGLYTLCLFSFSKLWSRSYYHSCITHAYPSLSHFACIFFLLCLAYNYMCESLWSPWSCHCNWS